MDSGFFGPGSMTWTINQEMTVLFGGARALLLHAAHPLVAAGARQTATYRRDPWFRLMRTVALQLLLAFGTEAEARHAADRINKLHTVINGVDPATGEYYDALDHDLLLWVHAALEVSTVMFYELTVRPLTDAERDQYHQENLTAAELMLLPRDKVPPTYAATERYVADVVESDRLMVTDVAREVGDLIRGGPVPLIIKPVWRLVAFAAVGTLPARVRRLYGFRFGRVRTAFLKANLWFLKRLRPWLPERFRIIIPARVAKMRLAGREVAMPKPGERLEV